MPDFAMSSFPGVKRFSGAFYYNEDDVNMINVPIAECQGRCILSADELKSYFGMEPLRMRKVPEYFITPRLDSTLCDAYSHRKALKAMVLNIIGHDTDSVSKAVAVDVADLYARTHTCEFFTPQHFQITGEVIVYKPLNWVPFVHKMKIHPKSEVTTTYCETKITNRTLEHYGNFAGGLTICAGGGWHGLKLELFNTAGVGVSKKTSIDCKEESTKEGKIGESTIIEVEMDMRLRMERVYEHSVLLFLDDRARNSSLRWLGCTPGGEPVSSSALRDVKHLQFHPISMTGDGHSSSLYMQALPVFGTNKELTDLHLLLSCEGWAHWYAYNGGITTVNSGRVDTLPLLDCQDLIATFMPVN